MKVYVVEHEYSGDHWVEKIFSSRQLADEYCIRKGCSKRMAEIVNTDWQNPKNSGERMYVTELMVEDALSMYDFEIVP